MLGKNNPQIDVFSQMIYDKLVPKDHLLVKINSIIDFSFVHEKVKAKYSSDFGRSSKDPAMMVKLILLEYLYNLSDVEVSKRAATDVVFRWFLGLGLDDKAPDDTTISHFRVKRLGKETFEEFFNEIVRLCIQRNLINTKRYIIDSTNVAVNASLPFGKKLIRDAYRKVVREIEVFDEVLAKESLDAFEADIAKAYETGDRVEASRHFEIAMEHLNQLYVTTHEELESNSNYQEAYMVCYDIADHHLNKKSDKIVSVVDTDARAAYKSPGNSKVGYKDHIIIDEDSEIILASSQTPFNVGDEKKLADLLEQTKETFGLMPEEVTADKVYGTTENRAYLKDSGVIANIAFYEDPSKERKVFGLKDFAIAKDLKSITCPNNVTTDKCKISDQSEKTKGLLLFSFLRKDCDHCPLREQCLPTDKNGKQRLRFRRVSVPLRYDALLFDLNRNKTPEFKEAYAKRFKVERRFGTMVGNHGLRRSRYVGLARTSIHIIMANMACNVVRMVNLLWEPALGS